MNQWNVLSKHFDGQEMGYNVELTSDCVFYPVVDDMEYHFIRFTENGEVYGLTSDCMYICDNLTHLYPVAKHAFYGISELDKAGLYVVDDITDEFRAYHAEQDDNEE